MVTKFGKFCRNLRMDRGELLYTMAQCLGVSSAFLSRVENGKAKPPKEWRDTLIAQYSLDKEQIAELDQSIKEARENVIRVDSMSQKDRDMMFAFARQLNELDENKKNQWRKLLNL